MSVTQGTSLEQGNQEHLWALLPGTNNAVVDGLDALMRHRRSARVVKRPGRLSQCKEMYMTNKPVTVYSNVG
jgi:hypothetical protein